MRTIFVILTAICIMQQQSFAQMSSPDKSNNNATFENSLIRNYKIDVGNIVNGDTYNFNVSLRTGEVYPTPYVYLNQSDILGYSLPNSDHEVSIALGKYNTMKISFKSNSGVGQFSDVITVSTRVGHIFIYLNGNVTGNITKAGEKKTQ